MRGVLVAVAFATDTVFDGFGDDVLGRESFNLGRTEIFAVILEDCVEPTVEVLPRVGLLDGTAREEMSNCGIDELGALNLNQRTPPVDEACDLSQDLPQCR